MSGNGESTILITFMLVAIRDALKDVIDSQNIRQDVVINVGTNEENVLALLRQDSRLIAKTLASTLGLTEGQLERILSKLKADGKIVRQEARKKIFKTKLTNSAI